ncbi:hypothetical protein GX411_08935 [Candidatus Fermentibacteria bacterium]|nr:hypothetical protein [Candidatus Fermentibacteria bacterium]
MPKATVDTCSLPVTDYLSLAREKGFVLALVRTSDREACGSGDLPDGCDVMRIPEPGVWGDGKWDGFGYWCGPEDEEGLEEVLGIIGKGSFPPRGSRGKLSPGQRRQMRDAMIFTSHVRHGHDVFVTEDLKGFISNGRRELLQDRFSTRIMTTVEFVEFLRGGMQ